jgi:hypothetical protein
MAAPPGAAPQRSVGRFRRQRARADPPGPNPGVRHV